MTRRRILRLSTASILLTLSLLFPASGSAQRYSGSASYFLHFSINALRQPVLCHRVDSADRYPQTYAVQYDDQGRPEQITRLFFGNLDSRAEWTIMRFKYDTLPSGSRFVRRTWHNPSGFKIKIGVAQGEDVLYDKNGRLLMVTAIDAEEKRVERVNAVTRTMYKPAGDGELMQEWRYSNNKQYNGSGPDPWNSQFGELNSDAWFRLFRTDGNGMLTMERPLNLSMQPVPFPGGELVRVYRRNECGQTTRVGFQDLDGNPMTDSSGVATITYDHDEAGRMVGWKSTDLNGSPIGRMEFNGAARMSREYRAFDGVLIAERFFDPDGNAIKPEESDRRMKQ